MRTSTGVGLFGALDLRAQAVDAHAGSFEEGGVIVVYRAGFQQGDGAFSGYSAQALPIVGVDGASSEILSADSGIAGGGAVVRIDLPEGTSVGQAVAAAEADPRVAHVQPIYKYQLLEGQSGGADRGFRRAAEHVSSTAVTAASGTVVSDSAADLPDDPALRNLDNTADEANQWWIPAVNAPAAWKIAHGDDNEVAVAVLDTGVNFEHPDLKANLLADYAYDACLDRPFSDSPASEEMAHGSHVAGIVAAQANNGKGIAGVSYNAKVLPIRVFRLVYDSSYGYEKATCDDEDLIRAYDYLLSDDDGNGKTVAEETHTRVVNMSLGGYIADDPAYEYDYAFEAKIEQAEAAGILTVAAGGNGDGYGNPRSDASYPCDYDAVMAVVALKDANTRAPWSDYGPSKNIAAPGCNIYSTWYYGDTYHTSDGTSMASPLVAGCAALLWAYDPTLSVSDVKDALYSTADDLGAPGFDPQYGWGRVNVGAALSSLGTASLKAQRPVMARTSTQQLTVAAIKDPSAPHSWKWSVDDPSKARISQSGVLTALAPGKVEVIVESNDGTSPVLVGRRTVEVVEMAIPGNVVASANPSENTIAVQWSVAEGAVKYRLMRSNAMDGEFSDMGTFAASELEDGGRATFIDRAAQPAVEYWYKVVPIGELDGSDVCGLESLSNRGYFTDKAELRERISDARSMLNATKVSKDGADLLVTDYWTSASARSSLNAALSAALTVFWNGLAEQAEVDESASSLAQAAAAFELERKAGAIKLPNGSLRVKPAQTVVSLTYTPNEERFVAARSLYRVEGARGALSYSKVSGVSGVSVTSAGDMKVAKAMPVGTYSVVVKVIAAGDDIYEAASESVTVAINVGKAANTLVVKAKNPVVKNSKKAKKARVVSQSKAYSIAGAKGALSFAKAGSAKVKVDGRTGAITVPKKLKKGTYSVKVNVTAAGDGSYEKAIVPVTVKVRVK